MASNDQILKEKFEEHSSNYENRLLNVFHQVFRLSEVSWSWSFSSIILFQLQFRQNQHEAVSAALQHHDCFVLMPTGKNRFTLQSNTIDFFRRRWKILVLSITSSDWSWCDIRHCPITITYLWSKTTIDHAEYSLCSIDWKYFSRRSRGNLSRSLQRFTCL